MQNSVILYLDYLFYSVYPNWDSLYSEPERNLMRIRRELYNKENELNNKRQEYLKVRVDLDTEWKTLQEKEEALKKSFMQFHKVCNIFICILEKQFFLFLTIISLLKKMEKSENAVNDELLKKKKYRKEKTMKLK